MKTIGKFTVSDFQTLNERNTGFIYRFDIPNLAKLLSFVEL